MRDRFREAFKALTSEEGDGFVPFRWQTRLYEQLMEGRLPRAVDLPTGLGKTSVMALWLIALAEGAKLPRRLVYIVDRRAVVDQATRFAEQLRRNMPAYLAQKLQLDADSNRLPISTLRGGFADNRDWLEDPSKPAIIVGTIDMIGSRLLFEGYGVSKRMRPYHAGLLGVDALVLLDEAHLCPPFESLLRQIEAKRDGELGPRKCGNVLTPAFCVMSLSATGREMSNMPSGPVFGLVTRDYEEPLVRERLYANKRLKLTSLTENLNLADALAEKAIALGQGYPPGRVLVYCNSRRDAVEVKRLIDSECSRRRRSGEMKAGHESELLVGERRILERTALDKWLRATGFSGGCKTLPAASAFLIATSAGEVGVDLDADHMVCDLVSYERMVQRLGRVNRRGGAGRTANIVVFESQIAWKASGGKAAIERQERDRKTLLRWSAPLRHLAEGEDGCFDASPAAISEAKRRFPELVDAATTPAPLHPELSRPLLDAWAMTSLEQHEGRPEVAPWLRGWQEEEEPQTILVWRKYLPHVRQGAENKLPRKMAEEYFRCVPVHSSEKLEASSSRVFDWLLKRVNLIGKRGKAHCLAGMGGNIVAIVLDYAGKHLAQAKLNELQQLAASAKSMSKQQQRDRDRRKKEWREQLLPGSVLVLDARIGGLCEGMLDEKSKYEEAPTADADADWRAICEDPWANNSRPLIGFRVVEASCDKRGEGLAGPPLSDGWRPVGTFETDFDDGGRLQRGLVVYKHPEHQVGEDARSIASMPQSLAEHAEQVAARARVFADRLNLPEQEADALVLAARLHDNGKAAERWQNAMNAPKKNRPYAKTEGGGNLRQLEGYRHEFGSLLKAESEEMPVDARDLILHLIAAHHGGARPLISSAGCDEGPPSVLELKAGEAALRFGRMQERYGPWGLAWREAILRAADQIVSRELCSGFGGRRDG